MIDKNLLIRRAIPFGDITEGELHEMQTFRRQVERADTSAVQRNPAKKKGMTGVYSEHFIPLGDEMMPLADMYNAADAVGVASSLASIRAKLERLLEAARLVYPATAEAGSKTVTYEQSAYYRAVRDLLVWLEDPLNLTPPRQIFTEGNGKLPYWCFSTLAGTTCPSAGACLTKNPAKPFSAKGNRGWCYSFKAWRQIFPFFRCLQNTLLIRLKDRKHIVADMRNKLRAGEPVRLYVDGDMDSLDTLEFWMRIVREFPQSSFYGYSKSWDIFLAWHEKHGGDWPKNYIMNLSSGTKFERAGGQQFADLLERMQQLPVARGRFVAVKTRTEFPKDENNIAQKLQYNAEVTAAAIQTYGVKPFVCPNYCGNCLNGKHACGSHSDALHGKLIAIGVH